MRHGVGRGDGAWKMDEGVPDEEGDGEWLPDPVQEANGVAFLLASAAFLTLADAHLRREGKGGLALMDEIEARITDTLQHFVAETPYEVARPDIILVAARKIRALLQAAREGARSAR
jgi:hypothetical protein